MPASALVPMEEYLATVYRPDCDYLDGVIEERNAGEWEHGRLQGLLLAALMRLEADLGIRAAPEVRVQVKPTRFRIPDICVMAGTGPQTGIVTAPPLLCVEVLSPEDRMGRMQERIAEYLEMGVRYVWVVNPQNRTGWIYAADGAHEAKDGVLRTHDPEIALARADVFARI
ncbi:MAG: Uma2 family endonuclease [Bryobacteraceae bacterium]|nr:Uma2 family endonuclease [Bryobacteraceae bacterium]